MTRTLSGSRESFTMLSAWNTNNVAPYTFMLPFGADDGYPTVPLLVAIISLSHMLFRSEGVPERRARFLRKTILRSRMLSLRLSVRDSDDCLLRARVPV